MRDVLDGLVRLSAKEIRVVEETALVREAEQQRLCGSSARLHADTGWTPEIPLTRTLADILAAAQSHGRRAPAADVVASTGRAAVARN
jgi:GDP-4-dehydro-6-deoxy-D-mannose reductase